MIRDVYTVFFGPQGALKIF